MNSGGIMELSRRKKITRGKPTCPMPKSRAITGPTPHSVAMLERPKPKRPADYLIIERLKKENTRVECVAHVNYIDTNDLRNMFLADTDKKILHNTIQRRVDGMLCQQKFSLDERREKLRELIMSEEDMYLHEMASKEETLLERQARMRERARTLREKREKLRAAEAERRLEQRWIDQCEELRGIKAKRHLAQVTKDRSEQLRVKEEEMKRNEKEEELYAQMWKDDWATKSKREDMETALQVERNKEMLDILNTQSAAREHEKEDTKALTEREGQLMREEAALRAVEEIKLKEDKKRRQRETRTALEFSLKIKMKQRAKEVQEELAFDMKLLEQMLTEHTNESQENLQRKKQLKKEVHIYRQHLQEQAEEERRREKELDGIVNAEVEDQWARRAEQWQREADARKCLLHDVLEIRKEQVKDKLALITQEKVEKERDRIRSLRNFEQHKALERKQEEEQQEVKRTYGRDLVQQMDYLELSKGSEREQLKQDWELCKAAEATYHSKVQDALVKLTPEKIHPTRLLLTGKASLFK